MIEKTHRVCLINGSLRGRKASSLRFLLDVSRRLPDKRYRKTVLTVRCGVNASFQSEALACMAEADALVFVFPLYGYGLPGALMRLLEEFHAYVQAGHGRNPSAKVYVVVNCAYPRPELTTGEAVRVMRNFCRRFSLPWRFAVCIGTGPVVAMTKRVPLLDRKLKQAFAAIAADISADDVGPRSDVFVYPVIPEPIIRRIREHYEKRGEMIRARQQLSRSDA